MVIFVLATLFAICIVGYVINVLFTSSGSELKGNSFNDFIAHDKVVNLGTNDRTRKYRYYERFSELPGYQLRIVYGTEYGASEATAKSLYQRLLSSENEKFTQFQPRLINCRDYQQVLWKEEQLVLFIISTSGDGVPPTDALQFMKYVQGTCAPVPQLNYSVLALGDSNYPHFCKTGVELDTSLQRLGAKCIADRNDVDMEDPSTISQWMERVFIALSTLHLKETQDYLPYSLNVEQTESYSRTNPFYATIKHKKMLTVSTSRDDTETVHVEFDVSRSCLTWQSGDALGIYPQNCPAEVRDLLAKAQLSGDALVRVDNERCTAELISLTEALTEYFNLKDVSLTLLSHFRDALNNSQLKEFKGEVRDLFTLYQTVHVRPQLLVQLLKPLLPRYYSISSSPLVNGDIACVTAAAVRYNIMDIDRTGVCSVHLVDRCFIGDKLGVFISHNPHFRLPSSGDASLLMIGPGTGLAPFMAFIAERVHQRAGGEMTLYFGCRCEKDFLYRQQLTKWNDDGVIKLYTAFSREHSKKVYVQNLMSRHSKQIFDHMQNNGYTYICGDATHMARDVHSTLLDICVTEGSMTRSQAADYLAQLTANCRYQKDVWVT